MRKLRLLSTVAAFVLVGTAAVSAQGMKNDEAPARAPAAQQTAPAEKIAPSQKVAPAVKSERKTPETTGQVAPKDSEKTEMNGQAGKDSELKNGGKMDRATEPNAQSDIKAKSSGSVGETTGQGAAAGSAKLSTEQRSKITSVIRQHKVAPVHLNVSVRVGTRVPDSVHFYPLPEQVIVIYPEWRGYDYILVGDEIVVIDPRTHKIVAVLEA
jgi:hypothetical protein